MKKEPPPENSGKRTEIETVNGMNAGTANIRRNQNIVHGHQTNVEGNQYHIHQSPPPPPPPGDEELLAAFAPSLRTVAEDCAKLVTRGLGFIAGPKQPRLAEVYVSLDTKTMPGGGEPGDHRVVEGRRPLGALEALLDPQAAGVVLVGDPGSGKSTFLQFVRLCLADQICVARGMASQLGERAVPDLLGKRRLVPLLVQLREFAAQLGAETPGTAGDVETFLRRQFGGDAAPHLAGLLRRGLALVLFDGLDEVPLPILPAVKAAINDFHRREYPASRAAVTCRTESYKLPEFRLENFPALHELAPLSAAQRERFVRAWYDEMGWVNPDLKKDARSCGDSLLDALGTDRLRDMAGNPFFLSAMATLHRPEKPLPDNSAELMDKLVDGVLQEAHHVGTTAGSRADDQELAALLRGIGKNLRDLRRCLERIAFEARETRQDRTRRHVDETTLKARLAIGAGADPIWVGRILETLRLRAGVLQSQDGLQFQFAYRFEEFLAGCHLANNDAWAKTQPSFAARCVDLLDRQGDHARQVVLWAAGIHAHVQRGTQGWVRELVSLLVKRPAARSGSGQAGRAKPRSPARPRSPGAARAQRLFDWELAADIARDAGMERWNDEEVADTGETVRRLRTALEKIRDSVKGFDVGARARAASAIGRLGDLRPGVGLDNQGRLPRFDWVDVPASKFKGGDGLDPRALGALRLSRYPTTVAQFKAFAAKGYAEDGTPGREAELKRWWGDEGLKWKRARKIDGPEGYDDPVFQTPNHPQAGVSWYEATAFCRWASEVLAENIRLPHEAEWEQAARWIPEEGKADDRYFAWAGSSEGDKDLGRRCNCSATGLGHTSAVGLFPSGQAACGALDMTGNVWEWCSNPGAYGGFGLRGGSWGDGNPGSLSVSYRNYGVPGYRGDDVGFRVVCDGSAARR